jgi:hypothetical protein
MLSQIVILADKLPPSDMYPKEPQRVEELPDSWVEGEGDGGEGAHGNTLSSEKAGHTGPSTTGGLSSQFQAATGSPASLQRMMPSCPEDCHCGCHGSRRRRNEGLVGSLLASLGVHYDLPWRGAEQDIRCKCKAPTWRVEFRPPPWLEARVWLLSGSSGTAGPLYSLRTARVVPLGDQLWVDFTRDAQTMRYSVMNGNMVYPDDRDEVGREIIEVSWNLVGARHTALI